MKAFAIIFHLCYVMLCGMCHRPALCTGRQTQNRYPLFKKSTFATFGRILSCQIALIANIFKHKHMLVY